MPATTQKILLDTDEVHVWLADAAGLEDGGLDRLRATLSTEEKESIERYRFQRDRDVHILSRGGLRQILSRYAALAPEKLEFSVTPYGKPCLNSPQSTDLRFSVSDSGGLVAWALSEGREIGIDVEQVRNCPISSTLQELYSPLESANSSRNLTERSATGPFSASGHEKRPT
jgi:4'-phosphopantetheinyl transferase